MNLAVLFPPVQPTPVPPVLKPKPSRPVAKPDLPVPAPVPEDDDMPVISKDPAGPSQYVHDYIRGRHIADPDELKELSRTLKRDDTLSTRTLAAIMANK
jgi:hypothetical protein